MTENSTEQNNITTKPLEGEANNSPLATQGVELSENHTVPANGMEDITDENNAAESQSVMAESHLSDNHEPAATISHATQSNEAEETQQVNTAEFNNVVADNTPAPTDVEPLSESNNPMELSHSASSDTTATHAPSDNNLLDDASEAANANLITNTTAEAETASVDSLSAQIADNQTKPEAANQSMHDEHDMHDDEEDDEDDDTDYSGFTKSELLKQAKELAKTDDVLLAYKSLTVLNKYMTALHEADKQEALKKYLSEGGEPDGFEFKDEEFRKFEEIYRDIAKKRKQINDKLYEERERNFKLKNELLDKLRELSQQEDSREVFEKVKEIQKQWKEIGPVHGPQSDSLYRSYHTLIDIYYNNHSIYKELIELDRKRNLQAKKDIIAQAKALLEQPFRLRLIKQLAQLKDEFRSIGSVPAEHKEEIYNEFKNVCDQLYERRKQYLEQQKEALQKEIEVKTVLVERAKLFEQYQSDNAKDWIETAKQVLQLQEDWKNAGHTFRSKTEQLSKEFWHSYKKFFQNKNQFFHKLEAERKANLKLKEALCEKAEALLDSQDFNAAVEEIKQLQAEWKKIGTVPIKYKETIWQRFRKAIDTFFEKMRAHSQNVQQEYQANLKAKEQICEQLNELAKQQNATAEDIERLVDAFQQAGFVPAKELSKINSRFVQAVDAAIENSSTLSAKDKAKLRGTLHDKIGKHNPEARKSLQKQETNINRRIAQLSHDINVWKTNLEFFAKSKNAQALKEEFNKKIQLAELELKELKEQKKLLAK